ncbi:MAG: hypothetical protein ACKO23_15825, partial [Gemmataceae bacterium]
MTVILRTLASLARDESVKGVGGGDGDWPRRGIFYHVLQTEIDPEFGEYASCTSLCCYDMD